VYLCLRSSLCSLSSFELCGYSSSFLLPDLPDNLCSSVKSADNLFAFIRVHSRLLSSLLRSKSVQPCRAKRLCASVFPLILYSRLICDICVICGISPSSLHRPNLCVYLCLRSSLCSSVVKFFLIITTDKLRFTQIRKPQAWRRTDVYGDAGHTV